MNLTVENHMRVSRVAALSLVFALVSVRARSESGHVFGTHTYSKKVPCESYSLPSEEWAKLASSCTARGFGLNIENLFDDIAGLDAENCVTTNKDAIPQGRFARLIPHCCAVPNNDGYCRMYCELREE